MSHTNRKMSQMSQMKTIWYVANVSFFSATPRQEFKIDEYIPFADLHYEVQNLLPYADNQKYMKLEHCLASINDVCKIEFNNYELKTDANVRVVWKIFLRFETKVLIKVEATISRSIEDIVKMLKCPHGY